MIGDYIMVVLCFYAIILVIVITTFETLFSLGRPSSGIQMKGLDTCFGGSQLRTTQITVMSLLKLRIEFHDWKKNCITILRRKILLKCTFLFFLFCSTSSENICSIVISRFRHQHGN